MLQKATIGLKVSKYHIFCSWLLLICFVASQYMVYAHQHTTAKGTGKSQTIAKNTSRQSIKEKCELCDAMHHTAMVTNSLVHFDPVAVAGHIFKAVSYDFTSIRHILSSGRAPPSSIYLV